ncbi:hypothetical protein AJ79_05829 [Helicocarpus griseus UAMH5409]|uniref:Uncharacterized protein n=1 Tax=Helicocarpus griseus UAMH5409 TaxID=1447875 RepID=A0A2B7XIR6_9EURO|nr:hypothetical protein AJ79_05829 [Helicocarpus griseus UAMH5409]
MKYSTIALFALSLLSSPTSFVLGQEDPGPSPTQSIGCEPHGDHWHCDAPAPKTEAAVTTTTTASTTTGAEDPGPSPTESTGCEPHGDHWHCDAPANPTATGKPSDQHEHEHEDEHSSQDPGPSPTESTGCEPHGDHWHCDAPAQTQPPSGAAAAVKLNQYAAVVGGVVAVMAL